MRIIIVLGSLLALIGLASTAQASDWHRGGDRGTRMHHESHADHERHEYRDRSRSHHEAEERRHGSRERYDESHERSERR